jgi:hypothetical protein
LTIGPKASWPHHSVRSRRSLLLRRKDRMEHRLVKVQLRFVACRIDVGIRATLPLPRVFGAMLCAWLPSRILMSENLNPNCSTDF